MEMICCEKEVNGLIYGNRYTIILTRPNRKNKDYHNYPVYYMMIDGCLECYPSNYFCTIEEWRNKKIKKIIDEQ